MNDSPQRQKGFAIIAVLMAVVVIGAVLLEYGTSTNIDTWSSSNARDEMKAEFLSRSGLNISQLLLRVQTDVLDKLRDQAGDVQVADFAPYLSMAFGGDAETVQGIGAQVGLYDREALESLGSEGGTFDIAMTSEDGKLNVNCANGTLDVEESVKAVLEGLLFSEEYNPIFESEDADGWRRTRKEQVEAILDFIDRDSAKYESGGAAEDYGYEALSDKYKAKNGQLDTLGEMRLIRGVDERFWTVFRDAFTIYGECKLNVSAIEDARLIAGIILLTAKNPEDAVLRNQQDLMKLARKVAETTGNGVGFSDVASFAETVKNPNGTLLAYYTARNLPVPPELQSNQEQVIGVELDTQKLGRIARAGTRRIYRVEVTASVPRLGLGEAFTLNRKVTAVWDTKVQNQNSQAGDFSQGAWVFMRSE